MSTPVLVGGGAGGLLLLVGLMLLTLAGLRRSQTRARLDRGDPGERIAGAWRELTDALRLAGRPVGADLAAGEVAEQARVAVQEAWTALAAERTKTTTDAEDPIRTPGAVGPPTAPHLAGTRLDERPGYRNLPHVATGHPGPAEVREPAAADVAELAGLLNQVAFAPATATPEQAERAAAVADGYVSALRAARPWWRRLLWSVHPGPLRWRN